MSVYILVLLGGQAIGGPAVGWLIDHFGARPSMFLCGGLVALMAVASGMAMARQSHLHARGGPAPRAGPVPAAHRPALTGRPNSLTHSSAAAHARAAPAHA